jgi:hypothetical protein
VFESWPSYPNKFIRASETLLYIFNLFMCRRKRKKLSISSLLLIPRDRGGWRSGSVIDLSSGGVRFESWLGQRQIPTEVMHGFLQVSQANAGIVRQLGHSRFLANPFPVMINQPFFYSTPLFRDVDNVVKQTTKKPPLTTER